MKSMMTNLETTKKYLEFVGKKAESKAYSPGADRESGFKNTN